VLVVGFDLDMTLVDSADGIVGSITATCERHGVTPDPADVRGTIGLPLSEAFPRWIPWVPYDECLAQYRAHYREHGIPTTVPMPGAHAAVDAVRGHGGRVVVVSAKKADFVHAVLEVVGIDVDDVVGDLYAEGKGVALAERGAHVYVGDHPGDVVGARVARAVAVAVLTGASTRDELEAAGADVVLGSLGEFPGWLGEWGRSGSTGVAAAG